MRRRHYYRDENRMTLCGHPLTTQERRHSRLTRPENINCRRCLMMKHKWNEEDR